MAEETFVIRIWCEYSDHEGVKPEFRGVIEHVSSGKRQYLPCFAAITDFIASYSSQPVVFELRRGPESGVGRIRQWVQQRLRSD